MIFKRTVQRYGDTPQPVTPYQRAAQAWDDRVGASVVQARNWRYLAFGAVTVSLVLSAGMVWLAGQNRITPYVVELDKTGEVKALGPATEAYSPSDAQVAWFLARFITNVRSLSIDPVLVRQNWLDGYIFTTGRAEQFLNTDAQAHDPFAGIGDRSVTVTITNVVRASKTSFQVKWAEQTYERGVLVDTQHWTGLMSVALHPANREDTLRKNPLGLYVTDLAWSRDYVPPAPATTPSVSPPAI